MSNVIGLITTSAEIPEDLPGPSFDDFWLLYPRHVAKLAARKAWVKVRPADHVPILEALVSWRQVWRDKDQEYLPHPATWLNGERWEDELPKEFRRTDLSYVPASAIAPSERTQMPEHVRVLLAKLRGKA